jgi:hypothetical protein
MKNSLIYLHVLIHWERTLSHRHDRSHTVTTSKYSYYGIGISSGFEGSEIDPRFLQWISTVDEEDASRGVFIFNRIKKGENRG